MMDKMQKNLPQQLQYQYSLVCQLHNKQVTALCTHPECQFKSRLCCLNCLIKDHNAHASQMIPLDELDQQTIDTPLPFNNNSNQTEIVQKIIQKMKQVQNVEQIKTLFDSIIAREQNQLNQIKEFFINKLLQYKDVRQQKIKVLEEEFLKLTSLKQVKDIIFSLQTNKISQDEFNSQVKDIFSSNQSDEQLSVQNELISILQSKDFTNVLLFDAQVWDEYLSKSEKLIQEYATSCQTFNIFELSGFKFVKAPNFKDASKLSMLQEGQSFTMNGQCAAISNIPLKEGKYKFTLEMKQYTGGCIVFGIENESKLSQTGFWGQCPGCCVTCNRQDTVGFYLVQGQHYLGENIQPNTSYQVTICLKEKVFQIGRQDQQSLMDCTKETINNDQYRFFVNNYSGRDCAFRLIDMSYMP